MARRHTRFVRPSPKTKMWIGSGVGETTIGAGVKTLVSSLSAGALALRPFTILRTRMLLDYSSDQDGANERVFCSYAKLVVRDAAFAIGVTAMPDPSGISGDPEADWFIWQAGRHVVSFDTASGFDFGGTSQYTIDSKAMRKVSIDDNVVAMCTEESAFGSRIMTNGRMLIQLH